MNSKRKLVAYIMMALLTTICLVSLISASSSLKSTVSMSSSGAISYVPLANLYINTNKVIANNKLSLGIQMDYEWKLWRDRSSLRQLTSEAGFKIYRLFDRNPKACSYWNETTKTGTFVWSDVDSIVQRIFDSGAEPLICLGYCGYNQIIIPTGMAVNASTGLPNIDSWAAYCKEWIKHFKSTGKPVRFYETMNEPWMYFGWNDYVKIANFMRVFNAAAATMKAENPDLLISFDGSNRKPVLDFWLANGGADLGFISFHKYDSGTIGYYSDQEMLVRAESNQLKTSSAYYGINDARQTYHNARGKWIPVINSEGNFNSASETGTDPRIQQNIGAVWTSLMLRTSILEGLDFSIYYCISSSSSWERANKASGGVGFGIIDHDSNQPWYPYYVCKMIGTNIAVGDGILETSCSSDDLRSLAWVHQGTINILLINKIDREMRVHFAGTSNQVTMEFIDSSISWETPTVQTGLASLTEEITVGGYAIMLLQF